MKKTTRSLLTAISLAIPCVGVANELHVYKLDLRGPAPELEKFKAALDEKAMPGLSVYSGAIGPDGNVVIDQTRRDVPSPDMGEKEPRRLGVLLKGQLTPVPGEPSLQRIKISIRECKHSAYLFAPGDKRFVPSWTESLMEVIGRIDAEGWALIDTNPDSKEPRQVFVMHVSR